MTRRTFWILYLSVLALGTWFLLGHVIYAGGPPETISCVTFVDPDGGPNEYVELTAPVHVGDKELMRQAKQSAAHTVMLRHLNGTDEQKLRAARIAASSDQACSVGRVCIVSCGWMCHQIVGCYDGCNGAGCCSIRIKGLK